MNRLVILILIIISFQLHSLEVRVNGSLYENYSTESLENLSYGLPAGDLQGIYLYELLPLMKELTSFRFISSDFIIETDMDDRLYISGSNDQWTLHSDSIGNINLPEIIEIEGTIAESDRLTIWMDAEYQSLKRELDVFAMLHKIRINYRVEKNLISLLEYNVFNDTQIPDLIIYNYEKLNRLSPLLREIEPEMNEMMSDSSAYTVNNKLLALPYQISRPLFLRGSSGGDNQWLTADFGDIKLFYPLLARFGMPSEFDPYNIALKDSLFYLTGICNQGILKLSDDHDMDFINGEIDSIYTSSTILQKIHGNLKTDTERVFPQLGGENPPPLLNYTFLSIARGSSNRQYSKALLQYLTGFGVQQRIDPLRGYLPYKRETYGLLPETDAKALLLEDLDRALWLSPDDVLDKLRFVIPKVYRLVLSGRLSIEEGVSEILSYIDNE